MMLVYGLIGAMFVFIFYTYYHIADIKVRLPFIEENIRKLLRK